ncbi:MAG TPA: septal ring lytic transglycosylase RlpA family protein [Acetobacteraceae bacterium]|jgi:rare lipoprotein A (peptidoglycan hydrolase)|nr:septal ring lytic transglycosylase RlpA family protein [Acetobacteraceae bacterium]
MIGHAKKVVPGMMFSVMLATPALAVDLPSTPTHADASQSRPSTTDRRRGARTYAVRHTVRHTYAAAHGGGADDDADASETAFINDATAWSSPGQDVTGDLGRVFQTGVASWYGGRRWNGNRTADGETYIDGDLTGAHATLPIGARVRVTVLDTGRSVVIRINDRIGTRRRVVDLSRAAAETLHMIGRGIASVSLARID